MKPVDRDAIVAEQKVSRETGAKKLAPFLFGFLKYFSYYNKKKEMKYIAEDVKIKVGEHMMVVKLYLNNNNICIEFTDEDEAKMPNGYIFDGYENELIIYPYRA